MAAAAKSLKFAAFFILFVVIASKEVRQSTEVDQNDAVSEEQLPQSSSTQQSDEKGGVWTIYEPKDFQKSELCNVLNCRRHELCLMRHNNAICVKKRKLDEVEGTKVYYTSPTSDITSENSENEQPSASPQSEKSSPKVSNGGEQNSVDEQEWDHQKFREKMVNHHQKLKIKGKNKAKAAMANEVTVDEKESHERHSQTMGGYEECTDQQLVAIEARLVQWFSDIHSQQPGERNVPLPKHKIYCREDVGWFFTQLDGDNSGTLTVDELSSLDHDPYEKCIKPFLDRCDINSDDVISLNEWCDCFQWSGHEREEPPCHAARRKHDPHLMGAFMPHCDLEGYYRPEQCHEAYCWCVDKWGREFDKSRAKGRPDCGQYAEPDSRDDEDD